MPNLESCGTASSPGPADDSAPRPQHHPGRTVVSAGTGTLLQGVAPVPTIIRVSSRGGPGPRAEQVRGRARFNVVHASVVAWWQARSAVVRDSALAFALAALAFAPNGVVLGDLTQ